MTDGMPYKGSDDNLTDTLTNDEVVASNEAPSEEDLIALEDLELGPDKRTEYILTAKLYESIHDKKHITAEFEIKANSEEDVKIKFIYGYLNDDNYIRTTDDNVINFDKVARVVVTNVTPASE